MKSKHRRADNRRRALEELGARGRGLRYRAVLDLRQNVLRQQLNGLHHLLVRQRRDLHQCHQQIDARRLVLFRDFQAILGIADHHRARLDALLKARGRHPIVADCDRLLRDLLVVLVALHVLVGEGREKFRAFASGEIDRFLAELDPTSQ